MTVGLHSNYAHISPALDREHVASNHVQVCNLIAKQLSVYLNWKKKEKVEMLVYGDMINISVVDGCVTSELPVLTGLETKPKNGLTAASTAYCSARDVQH